MNVGQHMPDLLCERLLCTHIGHSSPLGSILKSDIRYLSMILRIGQSASTLDRADAFNSAVLLRLAVALRTISMVKSTADYRKAAVDPQCRKPVGGGSAEW